MPFYVQIDKILDILCSQIYDSPLSLLRENVQNAYDAILQRKYRQSNFDNPRINVSIDGHILTIEDNGIGMDEKGLRDHYWTAGSSGKNTPEAKAAGVVGTFGIGAMANFGVCDELQVETRLLGSSTTYKSGVKKADLSLNTNCIYCIESEEQRTDYGTKIIITINDGFLLSEEAIIQYLSPYVQYLKVPVMINGKLVSMKSYNMYISEKSIQSPTRHYNEGYLSFDYSISINNVVPVSPQCHIYNILYQEKKIVGELCLKTESNILWGLRSNFGLAPINIATSFQLGGIVNLITLVPTAGREAVSRDSISFVSLLLGIADRLIAEEISHYPIADKCRELHSYIRTHSRYDLADYISIPIEKSEKSIFLKDVKPIIDGKKVYYYKGSDSSIIKKLHDDNNIILTFSNEYNRSNIQQRVLSKLMIEEFPDKPTVTNEYDNRDLSMSELSLLMKIKLILDDDYLLSNCIVKYAEISHGMSIYVDMDGDTVRVFLNRSSNDFNYIKDIYETQYPLFESFVKDMVRERLYPKFSQYLPSATKEGADALFAYLQRKKEIIVIENSDMGEVGDLMSDYLSGKRSMEDIMKAATAMKNRQKQEVSANSVGSVSEVIGNQRIHAEGNDSNFVKDPYFPMPPILRLDKNIKLKLLKANSDQEKVNGVNMFLCLSDKMFRDYGDFFYQPHTTNIIWSMHRIIYFFTHASNLYTLYYQMDLEKPLSDDVLTKGAVSIPTTTIITKNRIYIPIHESMTNYFNITTGKLQFTVNYNEADNKLK